MEKLEDIYGEFLLRFLLAQDGGDEPRAEEPSVTELLTALVNTKAEGAEEPPRHARAINLGYRLVHYIPDQQTTLGWAIHMQSGGALEPVPHDRGLERSLQTLARDAWPMLLLPAPEDWPYGPRGASTFAHPVYRKVMSLLLADDAIGRLFPGTASQDLTADNLLEVHSYITFSSGHGGGLQLATLPDMLLMSARARQFAVGDPESLTDFLTQVLNVLEEARELALGQEIGVPKLVGVANLTVPSDVVVELPFGKLRPLRPQDESLLPSNAPSGGAQLTAVLETENPLKILDMRPWHEVKEEFPTGHWEKLSPQFEKYYARGERNLMLARYSILLASEDELLAPVEFCQAVLEPLQHGIGLRWAHFVGQPSGIGMLDFAAAQRARLWADRVKAQHPQDLDLGVRRLLAAVGARLDPVDGFIDAIVCWENMFGSTAESTFRICGAMACLLQPTDKVERGKLFDVLKKLYEARSKVVHGAKELSGREAGENRTKSVKHALDAMRRLYYFPGILAAKGSAERGRDTLLSMSLDLSNEDDKDEETAT